MESINNILDEAQNLLKEFYKEDKPEKINTTEEFRSNTINFVANQMNSISKTDKLRSAIEAEILQKVALHELDASQLQSLYTSISNEKTKNTSALLQLFAPTQNTTPLITPATKDNEEEIINLTSEERNALSKLTMVMERLNKQPKNDSEE